MQATGTARMGRKERVVNSSQYVVFFNKITGTMLCAYDLKHTFPGEMYATAELLSSEKGLQLSNILVEVHRGKEPYVVGKGIPVTEDDIEFSETGFDEALYQAVAKANALPKEESLPITEFMYVGMGDFNMPAYKDLSGSIWLDINLGHGDPELRKSSNGEMDGEPDLPVSKVYKSWSFVSQYEKDGREMDYSMLNRLIADCKYAIYASGYNNGKIYPGHLYYGDVEKQIAEMKRLYNSFPEGSKPAWTSMEQIESFSKLLQPVPPVRVERGCMRADKIFIMKERRFLQIEIEVEHMDANCNEVFLVPEEEAEKMESTLEEMLWQLNYSIEEVMEEMAEKKQDIFYMCTMYDDHIAYELSTKVSGAMGSVQEA